MNTPVSFELAKLLKEKEFKPTKLFGYISKLYNPNTKTLLAYGRTGRIDLSKAYFAPTIAEVVMWLYEKHGIWISCETSKLGKFNYRLSKKEESKLITVPFMFEVINAGYDYNSSTQAYESAIEYTLNNLI